MTGNNKLQISARASGAPLTPDHKRFNSLIRQIAQVRQTYADWQENIPVFRQAHAAVLTPLRESLASIYKASVVALDKLLDLPGWSRQERADLRQVLSARAGELLSVEPNDAELKALYDKHSDLDFDTAREQELREYKEMAERSTGIDLGEFDGIETEEDLSERLFEKLAARQEAEKAAQEEKKEARARRKGTSAAQRKRDEEALLAAQSVRDIYRKLASAVHPDREPDPELRVERTELMQKINQAYAASDLLTLLEIQVQIEQVQAGATGEVNSERLKQYNKVLASQLAELKAQVATVHGDFRVDYGIHPLTPLHPQKLKVLIQEQADRLRAGIALEKRDLRSLIDQASAKRWLREHMRAARRLRLHGDDSPWDD